MFLAAAAPKKSFFQYKLINYNEMLNNKRIRLIMLNLEESIFWWSSGLRLHEMAIVFTEV